MDYEQDISFVVYQKRIIQVATELAYDKTVIANLKKAKTVTELTRIMCTARKAKSK